MVTLVQMLFEVFMLYIFEATVSPFEKDRYVESFFHFSKRGKERVVVQFSFILANANECAYVWVTAVRSFRFAKSPLCYNASGSLLWYES